MELAERERQELAELLTDYETLSRTEKILKTKFESVKDHLVWSCISFIGVALNAYFIDNDDLISIII